MEEREAEDLPALVESALALTNDHPDQEWWFRGQAKASWSLVPSLYRRVPDVKQAVAIESQVALEFNNRSRMIAERASARDSWELFFLMQHHRLPTRLLDWSRNLLIAAYFAAYDPASWLDVDDPPSIVILNPREWNVAMVGAVGMTVAGPSGVISDLTSTTMAGYEPRTMGSKSGPDQDHAVAIAGPEFAARIVAQRGAFTVFGTNSPDGARSLEEQAAAMTPSPLSKVKLLGPQDAWRRQLRMVGIGAFTAFPDLDGLSLELESRHFA